METHVKIAELQKEIEGFIGGLDAGNIIFEYHSETDQCSVDVITINPRHRQSFLFHTTSGRDKIEALENMLAYVKTTKSQENSYTIQWRVKGEDELHTSYFSAPNILDALDKFYYGRDIHSVNVFSVVLNPLT